MKWLGLLAVGACVLSACGQARQDGTTIAFLVPRASPDGRLFAAKVAALCGGCRVRVSDAGGDAAVQQQQARSALSAGADAVVLDPVDGAAAGAIVETANGRGVPVVSYDSFAQGSRYYLGFDDARAGRLQGQALVDKLGRGARIVMLNGPAGDANARVFKLAAHGVLAAGGVKAAREYDTPDWSASAAEQEMADAIAHLGPGGFAGVYAADDTLAGGAIAALKAAGIDPSTVPVTGQNADAAALARVRDGEQYMTVSRPHAALAGAAAALAVRLARGERPPPGAQKIAVVPVTR